MNTKDTYTEVYMGVFMQKNKRKVGAFYEEIAADYLVSQGVMILERNYRNWLGEIDLIGMTADGWLIFVEVKYRRCQEFSSTRHSFSVEYICQKNRFISIFSFSLRQTTRF